MKQDWRDLTITKVSAYLLIGTIFTGSILGVQKIEKNQLKKTCTEFGYLTEKSQQEKQEFARKKINKDYPWLSSYVQEECTRDLVETLNECAK
ncbi:hypothetical protein HOK51_03930 [Candidatus Woesearchaeota archaeon]|jgi:hypothetical protein|nr:hypothetical protein [Candidatus Woesearchaeota archaeon]MBT6518972.1 hypothetical protein [Candidatus Woesearchaeota archaeon]MBT7368337.1 hypothetical protein [Candidatus Woesearchaeota archaeon]